MSNIDFHKYQRAHIWATLFSAGFVLRKLFSVFWPLLIILFVKEGKLSLLLSQWWFYLAIGILFVWLVVHSYLSWKNHYFYISNGEFVVEKGYLKKNIISLPLEKIVSVNTKQNLLHQLLNVVEVSVDSAGSEGKEVRIKAVSKSFADALEEALSVSKETATMEEVTAKSKKEKKTIISLTFLQLLKAGIARNHLQGLLLILLFFQQIQAQLRDFFREEVDSAMKGAINYFEHSDVLIWVVTIIFLLILSFLFSVVRTILTNFDMNLVQFNNTFVLKMGLLKRKAITIPFQRIQLLKTIQNPLQKLLRINTMVMVHASSTEQSKKGEIVMLQGCSNSQIEVINNAVMKQTLGECLEIKPHWALRNRLFFLKSILLIPTSLLIYFYGYLWWLFIPAILWIVLSTELTYRFRKYRIGRELLLINEGGIERNNILLEHYKVQRIRVRQTYFQRRRNTATLQLGIAGANVSLAYIPYEKAIYIKDALLNSLVKNKTPWM